MWEIHLWIPLTKASDVELWCFLWSAPEQTVEYTNKTLVIWDDVVLSMTSLWWHNFFHSNWFDWATYARRKVISWPWPTSALTPQFQAIHDVKMNTTAKQSVSNARKNRFEIHGSVPKHNSISSCTRAKPWMLDNVYIKADQNKLFQLDVAYFISVYIKK